MNYSEIKQINTKLKEPFKKLRFLESEHKYWVEGDDRPIKSVSTHLKHFYDEFQTDIIAPKYAKSRGLDLDDVRNAWTGEGDIANAHGTKVHLVGEDYVRWKFFQECERPEIFDKQSLATTEFINDLPDYLIPVATELQMYSEKYWFSGTADGILYNTRNGKFIIYDWKGLPVKTPILTGTGWKTMDSLTLLDKVFDKDGNLVNIKHISNIKNKKCLKIKFDNNEEIVSDFEHRWLVFTSQAGKDKEMIMTTQEIFDYNKELIKRESHKILKIKNPLPLNLQPQNLPIDPYILGVWLGDGHSIDAKITQMNPKVWIEIEKRGYNLGKDVSQGSSGKAQTRTVFGLQTPLRILGLLKNKHIPEIYLLSSYEQRIDLLRGFMDADGYYNSSRKRFVLSTTRETQVDFTVEILGSLGIKPTILPCIKNCNGKKIQAWDVCFTTTDFNPFLSRNEDIYFETDRRNTYRIISSVEEVESEPTICIEVDSPSSTFLFGKSLIVTHNTNKSLIDDSKAYLKIIDRKHKLRQDNFGKYTLQFSFYNYLMKEAGFDVQSRILVWLNEDKDSKKLYRTYKTTNLIPELERFLDLGIHNKDIL